jgi:DnaJ-class molecular chaperone
MNIQTALQYLNLETATNKDQIHHAYRCQVKRWHPDQFAHEPAIHSLAEERLKGINQAYLVLKEHIKKNPPTNETNDQKKSKPVNKKQATRQQKPDDFSRWKQWFRSTVHKWRSNQNQPASSGTCQEKPRQTRKKNRSGFESILRAAAQNPNRSFAGKRIGAGTLKHPSHYKRRSQNTRIEGFTSPSPITPISPISKINRIESSD